MQIFKKQNWYWESNVYLDQFWNWSNILRKEYDQDQLWSCEELILLWWEYLKLYSLLCHILHNIEITCLFDSSLKVWLYHQENTKENVTYNVKSCSVDFIDMDPRRVFTWSILKDRKDIYVTQPKYLVWKMLAEVLTWDIIRCARKFEFDYNERLFFQKFKKTFVLELNKKLGKFWFLFHEKDINSKNFKITRIDSIDNTNESVFYITCTDIGSSISALVSRNIIPLNWIYQNPNSQEYADLCINPAYCSSWSILDILQIELNILDDVYSSEI